MEYMAIRPLDTQWHWFFNQTTTSSASLPYQTEQSISPTPSPPKLPYPPSASNATSPYHRCPKQHVRSTIITTNIQKALSRPNIVNFQTGVPDKIASSVSRIPSDNSLPSRPKTAELSLDFSIQERLPYKLNPPWLEHGDALEKEVWIRSCRFERVGDILDLQLVNVLNVRKDSSINYLPLYNVGPP